MFQIEEFPEIWADACLRDSEGQLMLLSAYGRDGSMMQLLAAIELGRSAAQGVDSLHLLDGDGGRHLVYLGDAKRLRKHAGRLPKGNLFGQLNQMWLFDKRLQELDRANRIGFVMMRRDAAGSGSQDYREQAWVLVKTLSPVALLDSWREEVLDWCEQRAALQRVGSSEYPGLGPVSAWRVSLSDHFTQFISDRVREQRFTLEGVQPGAIRNTSSLAGGSSAAELESVAVAA